MIGMKIKRIARMPIYLMKPTEDEYYVLLYGLLIVLLIILCFLWWIGYFDKDL